MTSDKDEDEDTAHISSRSCSPGVDIDPRQYTQWTLLLTSHAHSPPLQPQPVLKYDVRGIPNPPKEIRDHYTGLHKRLRTHMTALEEFNDLLERAEKEILEAMREIEKGTTVSEGNRNSGTTSRVQNEETSLNDNLLSVGCYCERGRHRSVALVEELGMRKWPKEWNVKVVHRDVKKSRALTRNQKCGKRKVQLRESYFGDD